MLRMKLGLLFAALALYGCRTVLVAIPGTERDATWELKCDGNGWWVCRGNGPIRQVCTETGFLSLIGHRSGCHWERFDPNHPDRGGATVPYEEAKR